VRWAHARGFRVAACPDLRVEFAPHDPGQLERGPGRGPRWPRVALRRRRPPRRRRGTGPRAGQTRAPVACGVEALGPAARNRSQGSGSARSHEPRSRSRGRRAARARRRRGARGCGRSGRGLLPGRSRAARRRPGAGGLLGLPSPVSNEGRAGGTSVTLPGLPAVAWGGHAGPPRKGWASPRSPIRVRRAWLVARVEVTYAATPTTSASARPGRSWRGAQAASMLSSRPVRSRGQRIRRTCAVSEMSVLTLSAAGPGEALRRGDSRCRWRCLPCSLHAETGSQTAPETAPRQDERCNFAIVLQLSRLRSAALNRLVPDQRVVDLGGWGGGAASPGTPPRPCRWRSWGTSRPGLCDLAQGREVDLRVERRRLRTAMAEEFSDFRE
jgi:hypothetical protein